MKNKKNLVSIIIVLLVFTSIQLSISTLDTKQVFGHSPFILIINFLAGIGFAAFIVKPIVIKTKNETINLEDYSSRKAIFMILALFMPWVFYLLKIHWSKHDLVNFLPLIVVSIIFLFFAILIYIIFIKRKFLKQGEEDWEQWEEIFVNVYHPILAVLFLLIEAIIGYFLDTHLAITPFPAISLIFGSVLGFVFIEADQKAVNNAMENSKKLYDI